MGLILPLKMFLSFGICASKPGERTHRLWVALFHGIMPPIAGGSRSSLWCTSSFGCGGCEIWLWGLVVIVFLRKWVPWNLEKYLLWRPSWLSMDALGCTSSTSGWVMGGGRFNCGRERCRLLGARSVETGLVIILPIWPGWHKHSWLIHHRLVTLTRPSQ